MSVRTVESVLARARPRAGGVRAGRVRGDRVTREVCGVWMERPSATVSQRGRTGSARRSVDTSQTCFWSCNSPHVKNSQRAACQRAAWWLVHAACQRGGASGVPWRVSLLVSLVITLHYITFHTSRGGAHSSLLSRALTPARSTPCSPWRSAWAPSPWPSASSGSSRAGSRLRARSSWSALPS